MGTRQEREALEEAERLIAACRKSESNELNLLGLGLTELPEEVRSLRYVLQLDISQNSIKQLPDWLCELRQLRILLVGGNPLRELPDCLGSLENLRSLYAAGISLKLVPPWLQNLKKLRVLNLAYNDLSTLPAWLSTLPLERLVVVGNQRLNLPKEIVESYAQPDVILSYFSHITSALPVNEFKLILVGRGGVGKTSLVHRLVHDQYQTFDQTPGINITKWPLTVDGDEVRAHVWDFGGQEIMHGTHRFFMTERAVYLVVLSGRENTEDHDAEYWLSLIRLFAGEDVPIIVLLHKHADYPLELNRGLLREKYGRNLEFLKTDSSTGRNIPELKGEICRQASSLPGLKAAWPAAWRKVKEELPASRQNWLTFEDFRAFCRDHGVPDAKEQEELAEALHALGLMLSYQREETLRRFGVLNPRWVTEGIYQMLNAPALSADGGVFTLESFAAVLPDDQYPKSLHPYLLALMRKFRLCHPLDEEGARYLIPELLTKEEPPDLDQEFVPEECLNFIYHYDTVLPEGLLSRFIVDTYVHRDKTPAWRTGAVLAHANCRALVRGDVQGRRVTIRVSGATNARRELLGIVRQNFERIHASYEKLPVTELVPVPGHPESTVTHKLLKKYEDARRESIAIEIGDGLQDFNVRELLDLVDIARHRAVDTIPLFISYAHEDSVYFDQLLGALTPYERTNELKIWGDQLIGAGQMWENEVVKNLDRARIVVLLLSNDFIRSDYAMDKEVPAALRRNANGDCIVVPVVVRPTKWQKIFGSMQVVMPDGKAISQHTDKDAAWDVFTDELDKVIARARAR